MTPEHPVSKDEVSDPLLTARRVTPRQIQLLTGNATKLEEFQRALGLHGVRVEQIRDWGEADFGKAQLVLRETTELTHPDGSPVTGPYRLQAVVNVSEIEVFGPDDAPDAPRAHYRVEVPGYLDPGRAPDADSFDWDYCFVHTTINQLSNDELRRAGCKFSARQKAIGSFAAEFLRLPRRHQFNFTPLAQPTTIAFDGPYLSETLAGNAWLAVAPPLISTLLGTVMASGVFLRAAKNRRERNYWLPGLNAGVPATPKKDSLHEITFLVHDLMHHLFADLCLIDASPASRAVYVVQRMLSEAFTLVLADMVFVSGLVAAGSDYDFSRRRIYPIYAEIGQADLRDLLWASARLCLAADEAPYLALGVQPATLARFRAKYDAFFVRDYQWTLHNAASLSQARKRRAVGRWLRDFAPVLGQLSPLIETTARLEAGLPALDDPNFFDSLLERVFADMYARIETALSRPRQPDPTTARRLAFRKYMAGQCFMYYELGEFYPQILPHAGLIRDALLDSELDSDDFARLRGFYRYSLEVLAGQNILVNADDLETYVELYPLFLPAYVSYDEPLELSLAEMAASVRAGFESS